MKCLRIRLTQSSANYRREETVTNKMTYPLPPMSTIIGALHNACGYTETHHMDIGIQGRFESLNKLFKLEHLAYNSLGLGRGTLVKYLTPGISRGYIEIAKQLNPDKDCNFSKNENLSILNKDEYTKFKEINNFIDNKKREKKKLEKYYDNLIKETSEKKDKTAFRKEKKAKILEFDNDKLEINFNNIYKAVTKLPTYVEVLTGIELIIHISADEDTLNDIYNNVYNIKSIGRSEDFVNVTDAEFVELYDELPERQVKSEYSAYLNLDAIRNRIIRTRLNDCYSVLGTKYTLNKLYTIENDKRIFEKKRVLYTSQYRIKKCSKEYKVYYDGEYIVNLI